MQDAGIRQFIRRDGTATTAENQLFVWIFLSYIFNLKSTPEFGLVERGERNLQSPEKKVWVKGLIKENETKGSDPNLD